MAGGLYHVKVWGDYACFTRPEFKVERVSYPVMTPSAARGILEALMWKPEMRWEIREIRVLSPVRQLTILRNEIKDRQGTKPLVIEEQRQQRMSLILKDVEYVITAQLELRRDDIPRAKYYDQFERRLSRGQCHYMPYLGAREFAASFEEATGKESPVALAGELGPLLFDIAYREDAQREQLRFQRQDQRGKRIVHGYAQSLFFSPELPPHPTERGLKLGIVRVPPALYRRLDRLEGRDV